MVDTGIAFRFPENFRPLTTFARFARPWMLKTREHTGRYARQERQVSSPRRQTRDALRTLSQSLGSPNACPLCTVFNLQIATNRIEPQRDHQRFGYFLYRPPREKVSVSHVSDVCLPRRQLTRRERIAEDERNEVTLVIRDGGLDGRRDEIVEIVARSTSLGLSSARRVKIRTRGREMAKKKRGNRETVSGKKRGVAR